MKKETTTLFICVFLAGLAFFLLNHHTPKTMDDFNYAFKFTEDGRSNEKISSVSEIPRSQYYHYFNYNGRTPVHFLAQFFSIQKSNTLFNILNSLMAVVLISLIALYSKMKTGYNKLTPLWLLSFALFWFLTPSPSMTLMWKTGSINYLWTSTLILGFLCLHHLASKGNFSKSKTSPFLWIFGVICGWGHEGLSIGISLGLLLHHIYHRKALNNALIFLVLGFWIGSSLVIFSPGILARADQSMLSQGLFTIIIKRLMAIYRMFFEMQTQATLIVTLAMLFLFFKNRQTLKSLVLKHSLICLSFGSFLTFQILTAFPGQGRGAMGMEMIAILILIVFCTHFYSRISRRAYKLIVTLVLVIFIVDYSSALSSCVENNNSVQTLVSDFNNSKDGLVRTPFPDNFVNDRFIFYFYSSSFNYPQNVAFSKFYDPNKSLVVVGDALYDEIQSGEGFFEAENLVKGTNNFFTTSQLDCYASKRNSNELKDLKMNVFVTYTFQGLSNETLDKLTQPLMRKVGQHYSGFVEATILNTERGVYLLVPKSDLPTGIALKEIKVGE